MKGDEAFLSGCEDQAKKTAVTKLQEKITGLRRTRSLNAPSPVQNFGPCAQIMQNSLISMTISDPGSQKLTWIRTPSMVLVIKKVNDLAVITPFVQVVTWLIQVKQMNVIVEDSVWSEVKDSKNSEMTSVKDKLKKLGDMKDVTKDIEFIICLGGDGTLLFASSLFQRSVPPILAFHMGSLGFLTPFKFENFQEKIALILKGNVALTLRSRLKCVLNKNEKKGDEKPFEFPVLNEVVIDRGPSPYLTNIELFLDDKYITSVQGDGLIVSTPTGSTAYAVAAGASMIHPSVPAILITPICPHSLSFRPIVVPAGVELKISISPDARDSAWASFDGRDRRELCRDDNLVIITSVYPVPSICAEDQIADWFDSLGECLHWNERKCQKQIELPSDDAIQEQMTE